MDITNQVHNSIKTYFKDLTYFGYRKQGDVDKLLVYSFLEELLTEEMRYFIKEDDYKLISKALSCLYGSSCLIPYPQYINDDTLFSRESKLKPVPRVTEKDDDLRNTESEIIRIKAPD